jgi:hypothetical protein
MATHRRSLLRHLRSYGAGAAFSMAGLSCLVLELVGSTAAHAADSTAHSASESPAPVLAGSRDGVLSLGVTFGSQAGPYGKESAGFRYGLWDAGWTGLYVQVGHNQKSRKSAAGIHCELGFDIVTKGRTQLSVVPVLAYGLSVDKEAAESQEKRQFGAALGLQLEVFIIESISTALRIEIGGQLEPAEDARWSTASSEVLFYYHLR